MTYHDNDRPNDLNPDGRPFGRGPRRTGFAWMFGLIAVLVLGGLLLMTMGRDDNVVTRTDSPATTTGAKTNDPTGANAPAKSRATDPTGANRATAPAPKQ
jgi:hypothetical protein